MSLPEPIMLPRRRASQSLETAAAWLFCGTEMLAAPRPAERVQLERKDGATLRPEVAPRARRDVIKQRQGTSRSRRGVGLVERLLESESHPVVEFVVQGAGRYKAFMPRTSCHDLNLLRMRTPAPRPSSACYRPTLRCFPSEADGPP